MYAFDLVLPDTLEDALAALADDEAEVLAGGQTLIPTLKSRLAAPAVLVSLRSIPGLRSVNRDGDRLAIGAATTHATVAREAASAFPALAALARNIGDPSVRNRGTIGGSVANNDPSACYPTALLACGATVVTNAREIVAEDYFQGMFETALDPGELITEIRFPIPTRAHYEKFWQPASRFALTGVFVACFDDAVRVAVTGASENGVFRWHEAEAALASSFTSDAVEALDPPSESMISDLHGSAAYRAHLARVLTAQSVATING